MSRYQATADGEISLWSQLVETSVQQQDVDNGLQSFRDAHL